jgi:hypothetical protein
MAPGAAKPFSREWKVESVANKGNRKIHWIQFGRTKLDGTVYPEGKLFALR